MAGNIKVNFAGKKRRGPGGTGHSNTTIRQRKRKRNKGQFKFWLIICFIILLLLSLAAFMFKSPFFKIASLEVEGNVVYSDEDLLKRMGDVDSNIFLFSKNKAKKRIMEMDGMKDVSIRKKLPNRLYLKVDERYCLAKLDINKQNYYLDDEGILMTNEPVKAPNLPIVNFSYEGDKVTAGKALFKDDRYLSFLKSFQKSSFCNNSVKLHFEKTGRIVIMYNDIIVQFGQPDDILKKLADLKATLDQIGQKAIKAEEILLDEGKNPIVVTEHPDSDATKEQIEKKTEGEP